MNARVLTADTIFAEIINPRTTLGLNTSYNGSAYFTQNPTVGRPGRSTDLPIPVDRTVDPKNPRVGCLSVRVFRSTARSTQKTRELGSVSQALRSTGPVDRSNLCACCARRSTDPSDSCCCPFAPLPFIVDFLGDPRRHLALFYSCLVWHLL